MIHEWEGVCVDTMIDFSKCLVLRLTQCSNQIKSTRLVAVPFRE